MFYLACDGVYLTDDTTGFISCQGELSAVTEVDLLSSLRASTQLTQLETQSFMSAGLQIFAIAAIFAIVLRLLFNK